MQIERNIQNWQR